MSVFSVAVFRKIKKPRARPDYIAAGFVFWTSAFRRINEPALISLREEDIFRKNRENSEAIFCNEHGRAPGQPVVLRHCCIGLKYCPESAAYPLIYLYGPKGSHWTRS